MSVGDRVYAAGSTILNSPESIHHHAKMSFINSNGEEVSTYDNTTSLGPSTQPHLSNGGSATVGNPSTNDNITTPLLLQQYNALRRPLALSHGHRKWSSNSNNSPKYECTAHQTNTHNSNNGSFAMNGGTTDYAHYQHHAIHGNNHQCQHEQVQSLRRLSGQGSGFRQACEKFSELDAENTEMLLPDNVRGFRRNHGDSYPNEDEHLLNGHHIPKQQQQPQHLFQHQNYSEEYCSIEETHMMRNIKEESKHLLEHRWCLFMLQDGERRTQESWNDSQVEVHRFNTVEDFWCMVNHIHPPSNIGVSDYSLFKEGIKPAWEDPAVSQGGRWVAKLPTKLLTADRKSVV